MAGVILELLPTLLKIGPYRFFVYSNENGEPCHVHVQRESLVVKFWLLPVVSLASNGGFRDHELRKIERIIEENRESLIRGWNEYFGS